MTFRFHILEHLPFYFFCAVADNLVTSLQVSLNECKSSFESAVSNLDQLQHRSDAEINQIQLQFADTQEEKKLLLDKISNLNDEIIMLKETNLQLTKDLKDERQKYQVCVHHQFISCVLQVIFFKNEGRFQIRY